MKNSMQYNAEQDINLLRNVEKTVEGNLAQTLAGAQALVSNLKILQSVLHDTIDNKISKTMIASKYASNNFVGQSATLPGVTSSSSLVDIDSFRQDSSRMEELKSVEDKLESQMNSYNSICAEDIKSIIKTWKQMTANMLVLQDSLETVNMQINPNY